jgi:hypothetical protein
MQKNFSKVAITSRCKNFSVTLHVGAEYAPLQVNTFEIFIRRRRC